MEHALDAGKKVTHDDSRPSHGGVTGGTPVDPILQLQQQAGNQAVQRLLRENGIQAKLAIGSPDDPAEREADEVSDRIMGNPGHSSACTCSGRGAPCESCQKAGVAIQRQPSASGVTSHVPASVAKVLSSHGRPLDGAARAFFEPRFGERFDRVRVHAEGDAAESARSIDANAYTAGDHVVFGSGQYAPDTEQGKRLLAHELTHVVQQRDGARVQSSDTGELQREEAPASGGLATIRRQPAPDSQPHAGTQPGFGKQPHAVGQPHVPRQPGFGNDPHAVDPAAAPPPPEVRVEILEEPADYIERFKILWTNGGQTALETYVYTLLHYMKREKGIDWVDRFADQFWDYIWVQIGGHITDDPTVQMMVGFGAAVVLQQKRIKEEIEAAKAYIAFFEQQARNYTLEVLMESENHVRGELTHYGLTWPTDPAAFATWATDAVAARHLLGIAAAGLARRRNALITANTAYRNMVRHVGYSKAIEDEKARADRDFEVFRIQVVPRFPILEEITSPEMDPFQDEDAEPDDTQGEQLNALAQLAKDESSKGATDAIVDIVFEKLHNIDRVRKEIKPGGDLSIWNVPEIVQGTRKRPGVVNDPGDDDLIQQKFADENKPPNESETLLGKILLYGGLVLAPFTDFLSLAPYGIYKADKAGAKFFEDAKQYMIKKALHGTDFGAAAISAEDPSLFWLAGDILNVALAGIDLALMAVPAARVFRELAPLARAAREVKAGEAALEALNSTAKQVASRELGLGVKEAGDFAAEVTADARAARTGSTVGETADEADMLKQARPQAEDAKVLEEAGSQADEAKASGKAADEVAGEGAGTKTIPAPPAPKPPTLPELHQQAAPLRAEKARLAGRLHSTETRVQNLRERIEDFEKLRAERGLPPKPEFLQKELEGARAEAANQLRELEQAEGKLAEVESEIAKQTPPDPSRPSPRQSEIDVGKDLGYKFKEQQSYLNHEPVPYATEGSVRPDWVAKDGSISVEVKNYNIADNSDGLIDNVSKQAIYRTEHLPVGMRQEVVIDVRGQVVSQAQEQGIIKGIVGKSKGAIAPENITFKR